LLCSRKELIDQFKLTRQDISEMAVAHGSTAELVVRTRMPTTHKKAMTVYDLLKADPHPNIEAIVNAELAKRLPKIEAKCKCVSSPVHPYI
jgi:hypothetical protein